MTTKQQLDSILEKWDLLKHPFYQAWSAGSLPVEALKVYAQEYGTFINILEDGWKTLGDLETAEEEREHAELWEQFAFAMEAEIKLHKSYKQKSLSRLLRACLLPRPQLWAQCMPSRLNSQRLPNLN